MDDVEYVEYTSITTDGSCNLKVSITFVRGITTGDGLAASQIVEYLIK